MKFYRNTLISKGVVKHKKRKEGKQMKLEARWDNTGRDQLTIGEMVEMGKDGYEFVISGGHIVSVLINL